MTLPSIHISVYFVLKKYINSKSRYSFLSNTRNFEKFGKEYARLKFFDKTLSQSGVLPLHKLPKNIKTIPTLTISKIN